MGDVQRDYLDTAKLLPNLVQLKWCKIATKILILSLASLRTL